jgi:hypothetical protein
MKLALAAACLAASLMLAGHVSAQGITTVNLEQPVPAKMQFIADGADWVCQGQTCVSSFTPQDPIDFSDCQALAKQVGRVSAYKDEDRALKPADLDRCNKSAVAVVSVSASR